MSNINSKHHALFHDGLKYPNRAVDSDRLLSVMTLSRSSRHAWLDESMDGYNTADVTVKDGRSMSDTKSSIFDCRSEDLSWSSY